jgi:pyruvate/2-oxoglutarate dehydrogenase complex dihydrolipoamide dehydrogenase (E3) component
MNILHVLSQFEVIGAEVYAVTLASAQRRLGHSVTLISDTLHFPYEGSVISQAIGKRSYLQRFRNIVFLIHLIRENKSYCARALEGGKLGMQSRDALYQYTVCVHSAW